LGNLIRGDEAMSGDNENGTGSSPVSVPEKYCRRLLEFSQRMMPGSENFKKEVLLALDELFGFDRTVFLHIGEDGTIDEYVGHRMGGQSFRLFGRMDAQDDFFASINPKRKRRVCSIRDVMSYEEYEHTEHHEALRLCKAYYQAVAYISCGDGPPPRSPFSGRRMTGSFRRRSWSSYPSSLSSWKSI
jgi:hypothetical protein